MSKWYVVWYSVHRSRIVGTNTTSAATVASPNGSSDRVCSRADCAYIELYRSIQETAASTVAPTAATYELAPTRAALPPLPDEPVALELPLPLVPDADPVCVTSTVEPPETVGTRTPSVREKTLT